jgi:hypothetical protein
MKREIVIVEGDPELGEVLQLALEIEMRDKPARKKDQVHLFRSAKEVMNYFRRRSGFTGSVLFFLIDLNIQGNPERLIDQIRKLGYQGPILLQVDDFDQLSDFLQGECCGFLQGVYGLTELQELIWRSLPAVPVEMN